MPMKRIATLAGILLITFAAVLQTRAANPLDVLIVDPGHTDTGDAVARALKSLSDATIDRVDMPALREARIENRSAIIWIGPEPTLYAGENARIWKDILADHSTGLMVLGLPGDDAGRAALFAGLKDRGHPGPGAKLGRHLEHAWWIWPTKKPADNTTGYFRKSFNVAQPPARTFIQAAADNRSRIILNGTEVGHSSAWKNPESFDVTKLVRAGRNVLAIEAFNEDGPAGVILKVIGTSAAGENALDLPTDKTWKATGAKPADNWTSVDFDDSKLTEAQALYEMVKVDRE
jgi:hypothetical protein